MLLIERVLDSVDLQDSESNSGSSDSSSLESHVSTTRDLVTDLIIYNDSLSDLVPALKNPTGGELLKESTTKSVEGTRQEETTAKQYISSIVEYFPSIDKRLAVRLAETNLQRFKRLAKTREKQMSRATKISIPDIKDTIDAESTVPSSSSPSIFSDAGRTTLRQAGHKYTKAESVTSISPSIMNNDPSSQRRRMPRMPENQSWGASFVCSVCGTLLENINSQYAWQ